MTTWRPEEGDAALYALSGLFALLTIALSGNVLYRQWATLAIGPYAGAAILSLAVGRRRRRREADRAGGASRPERHWTGPRVALFLVVLFGATLIPLSLEVAWRTEGDPAAHVQPEVAVVELAGHRAAHGISPYQSSVKDGKVVSPVKGWPAYQSFYPYLPLMTVFGLPSGVHGAPPTLTDARVMFSGVTLIVVLLALGLIRAPGERKIRALQVLTVLPTAALLLATGGDDMPILAFLLLAMALAQRRRPGWSGIVLGIVSAMKFTAWPLALLALFAARDGSNKRAPGRMLVGMFVIAGPVVTPFLIENPHVFIVNVILFPLGLSGVASPAASPLPGHLLVNQFPVMKHVIPIAALVLGGAFLGPRLMRRPPRTAAEVTSLAAWVMLVAIVVAPATRIGYLVYPINFFVWSFMFKGADRDAQLDAPLEDREAALA